MDKKDIYEHLAKIYLDASSKNKNQKSQGYPKVFRNSFFISLLIIVTLTTLLFINLTKDKSLLTGWYKSKPINSEFIFILQSDIVKINFNFGPTKKEIYSMNLNNLNLDNFKAIGFSLRKINYQDNIILKVEFSNTVNEKSEIYLNDIPAYKWQDYKISLSEFKDINDWSCMSNLSFIVDEWNTQEKKGIVYIDNIRLLR